MTDSFSFPRDICKIRNAPMEFPLEPSRLEFPIRFLRSSQAYICVPWRLGGDTVDKDRISAHYLLMMMEQRLLHRLRIQLGQVYEVDSRLCFDDDYFAHTGNQDYMMAFRFTFFVNGSELVEEALMTLERFREYGPSVDDLALLMRASRPTNMILSEKLVDAYLSPLYESYRDVAAVYKVREQFSSQALALDTEAWRKEIQRLMPYDLIKRYVSAVLYPLV